MADRGEYSVCVFCGSRFGNDESHFELAEAIGHGLAERGMPLVYGGGDVGLMGTVAGATMAGGGKVFGYIPQKLMDIEVGKSDITELEVTGDMFVRKRAMIDRSRAFVALPGGLGTADEIFDAITLKQLGYHKKPVLLLGPAGFWQPFAQLIDHLIEKGFAGESAASLHRICETVEDVWAILDRDRQAC